MSAAAADCAAAIAAFEAITLFGVGMDANIISASLKAIVSGLTRARMQTAGSAQSVSEPV